MALADLSPSKKFNPKIAYTPKIRILMSWETNNMRQVRKIRILKKLLQHTVLSFISNFEQIRSIAVRLKADMVGYKIVTYQGMFGVDRKLIAKLVIPQKEIIILGDEFTGSWSKMRASKAEVISISSFDQRDRYRAGLGRGNFLYEVGKTVKPQFKFARTFDSCASGIHFFESRNEAMEWGV